MFSHRDGQGRGRGRRQRKRLMESGMLRYIVLDAIATQPRHGYELIKLLEEQSGGWYTPSSGVIYPMLNLLEDNGYVSVQAQGSKKRYFITEEGKRFLQENQVLVNAIRERLTRSGTAEIESVRDRLEILREVVHDHVQGKQASAQDIRSLIAILDQTITKIQAL